MATKPREGGSCGSSGGGKAKPKEGGSGVAVNLAEVWRRTLKYMEGTVVKVKVKDGKIFEGIFVQSESTADYITLLWAKEADVIRRPYTEKLSIKASDLVTMFASGVKVGGSTTRAVRGGGRKGFLTDTQISNAKGPLKTRQLTKWKASEEETMDMPADVQIGGDGTWDQFATHEKMTGRTSTYNEDDYTLALDKNSDWYKQNLAAAREHARQINSKESTNIHEALERGQEIANVSEEDLFSTVLDDPVAATQEDAGAGVGESGGSADGAAAIAAPGDEAAEEKKEKKKKIKKKKKFSKSAKEFTPTGFAAVPTRPVQPALAPLAHLTSAQHAYLLQQQQLAHQQQQQQLALAMQMGQFMRPQAVAAGIQPGTLVSYQYAQAPPMMTYSYPYMKTKPAAKATTVQTVVPPLPTSYEYMSQTQLAQFRQQQQLRQHHHQQQQQLAYLTQATGSVVPPSASGVVVQPLRMPIRVTNSTMPAGASPMVPAPRPLQQPAAALMSGPPGVGGAGQTTVTTTTAAAAAAASAMASGNGGSTGQQQQGKSAQA